LWWFGGHCQCQFIVEVSSFFVLLVMQGIQQADGAIFVEELGQKVHCFSPSIKLDPGQR
jgi:hypothetical protein